MGFHLAAWRSNPADVNVPLDVVPDRWLASTNPNAAASANTAFLPPVELKAVAAYALGGLATSPTFAAARVVQPTLARLGQPSIRPIDVREMALPVLPPTDPNLAVLLDRPIVLAPGEPFWIEASATGADIVTALLWVCDRLDPAQPGEGFWMRFTASGSVTAGAWSPLTISFEQTLPGGTYQVVGFDLFYSTAIAARIAFPNSVMKPGIVAMSAVGNRTHRIFYEGALGALGTFNNLSLPSVELLVATTAASASAEGYMRLVRVGDSSVYQAGVGSTRTP